MNLDVTLTTHVKAYAAVTAIQSTRFFPVNFPPGVTMPCSTYQLISQPHQQAINRAIGQIDSHYQIDCWASDYDGARNLTLAMKAALLAFTGSGIYGMAFNMVNVSREPDSSLFRGIVDVTIAHA